MNIKLAPPESTCDPSRLAREVIKKMDDEWADLNFPFGATGLRWARRVVWGYWCTYFVTAVIIGSPYHHSPFLAALAIPGAIMIVVFLVLLFALVLHRLFRA